MQVIRLTPFGSDACGEIGVAGAADFVIHRKKLVGRIEGAAHKAIVDVMQFQCIQFDAQFFSELAAQAIGCSFARLEPTARELRKTQFVRPFPHQQNRSIALPDAVYPHDDALNA